MLVFIRADDREEIIGIKAKPSQHQFDVGGDVPRDDSELLFSPLQLRNQIHGVAEWGDFANGLLHIDRVIHGLKKDLNPISFQPFALG